VLQAVRLLDDGRSSWRATIPSRGWNLRTLPALAGRRIEAHVLAPLAREMLRDVIEQPAPTLPGLGQSGSFEHRQKGAR
jgi:hypothetical protein